PPVYHSFPTRRSSDLPINLASEPFRRDRPMLIGSGICAVLLCGLLGVLVFLIMGERDRAKESREAVNRLQQQLSATNSEQAKLEDRKSTRLNSSHVAI